MINFPRVSENYTNYLVSVENEEELYINLMTRTGLEGSQK